MPCDRRRTFSPQACSVLAASCSPAAAASPGRSQGHHGARQQHRVVTRREISVSSAANRFCGILRGVHQQSFRGALVRQPSIRPCLTISTLSGGSARRRSKRRAAIPSGARRPNAATPGSVACHDCQLGTADHHFDLVGPDTWECHDDDKLNLGLEHIDRRFPTDFGWSEEFTPLVVRLRHLGKRLSPHHISGRARPSIIPL
jgi:hypothetical protein